MDRKEVVRALVELAELIKPETFFYSAVAPRVNALSGMLQELRPEYQQNDLEFELIRALQADLAGSP